MPTNRDERRSKLFRRPKSEGAGFAMIQPHRAQVKSPATKTVATIKSEGSHRRSPDLVWQSEAYDLAEAVGEAGYVMNLTANTVSMCDFLPRVSTDEGLLPAEDPRVLRVMEALVPPRGGIKEIKRRLALHACIAGEWYLVGTPGTEGTQQLGILWEALSVREVEVDSTNKVTRTKHFESAAFKAFWERLARKTDYTVAFDEARAEREDVDVALLVFFGQ